MSTGSVARSAILNEQELWREMVRWSGGVVHEQDGLLFVAGPSSYLRVMIRMDGNVSGPSAVRRSNEFFGASEGGDIVLVREPDDTDLAQAALAAGYTPAWTERPMALHAPPRSSPHGAEVDVRIESTPEQVVDYGMVVARANDDPGERERAGLLFHDRTILEPPIAAFVAYLDGAPVSCAMTLVSHGVAGVFSTSRRSSRPAAVASATRSPARPPALGSSSAPAPRGSAPRRWALTSTGVSGSRTSARRSSSMSHRRRVATERTGRAGDLGVASRSPHH
jgi:hypothetical protein